MDSSNITIAQNNQVTIMAHRGASGIAPENTLSAIKEAINLNADYAELDVQETADGEIILLHDNGLKRTTGLDKNIWITNYDEIKFLDAGSWFSEKYKGEPIPKFKDVIDLVRGKLKLNIELKTNGHEKQLADRVVKIVKDKNVSKECFFTSFDYAQIKRVKEIDSTLKVGLIFKKMPDTTDVFKLKIEALSVHYSLIDQSFILKASESDKEIFVWTVNDENEMKKFVELNVKGIITNYPDKLKKVINEFE